MPSLLAHYGLFMVAGIIFAGEIGLPTLIPGEVALLFAGSQFIHSPLQLLAAILIFGLVDICATSTIHLASRSGGHRLLRFLLRHVAKGEECPEARIERWRARLGGHDSAVVFVTRMIPMFRLYASITTGLIRVRLRSFFCGAGPASWVWATTPLTLGYIFRHQIGTSSGQYTVLIDRVVVASVLITLLLAFAAWLSRADSFTAGIRRVRLVIGLAAFLAAGGRLLTMAILGAGSAHQSLFAILPALPVRVGLISAAALGLLWIFAHDLRAFRTRHPLVGGIGVGKTAAWMSFTTVVALIIATTGFHLPLV